jgi:hypothetical protein
MSVHIIKSRVVFFGPTKDPKAVRWWAENGFLHYEDSRTGAVNSMSRKEFLLRLDAVNQLVSEGRKKENEGFMSYEEIDRHMKFIEEGIELAKLAKEQGDLTNPKVLADKEDRKPVSIVVPGN